MKRVYKKIFLSVFILVLASAAFLSSAEAIETWHRQTADSGRQYPIEMGYDSNGNPGFTQVDYYGSKSVGGKGFVFYRRKTSSGWVSEDIGPTARANASLAYGKDGQPSILYNGPYVSGEQTELIYAKRKSDGTWSKSTVATDPYWMDALSLEFNNSGQPCDLNP